MTISETDSTKGMCGFKGAINKASSVDKGDTKSIFGHVGDGAWLAYYIVVGMMGSYFPGNLSKD